MEITLTQGKTATIDDADAPLILKFKWCAWKSRNAERWYAMTRVEGKHTLMHSLLTGWYRTDHRDGDGLNNRRENLRQCTNSQNGANRRKNRNGSSRFKGVSLDATRRTPKWVAHIRVNGNLRSLGRFLIEEDAAAAYRAAAIQFFGEFARF